MWLPKQSRGVILWHSVLVSVLGAYQAFAPAPIRLATLSSKQFVLAPWISPGGTLVPPQALKIWDQPGTMSLGGIPYFTPRSDGTIALDPMNLCIEAGGDDNGDVVRVNGCTGGPDQSWDILPGWRKRANLLQLRGTHKCIAIAAPKDALGPRSLDGAMVKLHECDDHEEHDLWDLELTSLPRQGPAQSSTPSPSMRWMAMCFMSIAGLGAWSLIFVLRHGRTQACVMIVRQDGVLLTGSHCGVSLSATSFDTAAPQIVPTAMAVGPVPEAKHENEDCGITEEPGLANAHHLGDAEFKSASDGNSVSEQGDALETKAIFDGAFAHISSWQWVRKASVYAQVVTSRVLAHLRTAAGGDAVERAPVAMNEGIQALRNELALLQIGDGTRVVNVIDATLDLVSACHAAGFSKVSPSADRAVALAQSPLGSWLFDADISDNVITCLATYNPAYVSEAAQSLLAGATFLLRSEEDTWKSITSFEAALRERNFLTLRQTILDSAKDNRRIQREALTDEAVAKRDGELFRQLNQAIADHTAQDVLCPNEFPTTMLGLNVFVVATRNRYGRRAAAAIAGVLHAADDIGPLILPETQAAEPELASASTLIIAFSSMGWGALKRPEWGRTLQAAKQQDCVVAHAMDTQESWYCGNPCTGELDGGKWWDEKLAAICAQYPRVCLIGDSMGGTAALRFARHAKGEGRVVAFVPQVDLIGWDHCRRLDFTDELRSDLQRAVVEACANTEAHIVVHVGDDPFDESQAEFVRGFHNVKVVRHEDIRGHLVSTNLKMMGLLEATVLDELLVGNHRHAD